jgi:hypothetical protein
MSDPIVDVTSVISASTIAFVALTQWNERRRAEVARRRSELAQTAMVRKLDTNTAITKEVHEEVKSINGTTGPELLEANEGRRVQALIDKGQPVTDSEQGYADRLDKPKE